MIDVLKESKSLISTLKNNYDILSYFFSFNYILDKDSIYSIIECNKNVYFHFESKTATHNSSDLQNVLNKYIENNFIYIYLDNQYKVLGYKDLVNNITTEIESKDDASKLALIKISIKKPYLYKYKELTNIFCEINSNINLQDIIYVINNDVYLLVYNIDTEILDKLKSIKHINASCCYWDYKFVPVDLISEVDNDMYLKEYAQCKTKKDNIYTEVNNILDSSIFYNKKIIFIKEEHYPMYDAKQFIKSICFNNNTYFILYGTKKNNLAYIYNQEDIAEDLLPKLEKFFNTENSN